MKRLLMVILLAICSIVPCAFGQHYDGVKGRMLIIVPNQSWADAMVEFVDWKKQKGIEVVIGVVGGPEASDVEALINLYYIGNTNYYVLLVGDGDLMPYPTEAADYTHYDDDDDAVGEFNPADNAYADTHDDGVPDFLVGRFSAEDIPELETQIKRSIWYERDIDSGVSYLNEASLFVDIIVPPERAGRPSQSDPGGQYHQSDDGAGAAAIWRERLIAGGYDQRWIWTLEEQNPNGLTAAMISSKLSVGLILSSFEEHNPYDGSDPITETGNWGGGGNNVNRHEMFTRDDIRDLNNANQLPFIVASGNHFGNFCDDCPPFIGTPGVSCSDGTQEACFAEVWMRHHSDNDPRGAIGAFMSSSRSGRYLYGEDVLYGFSAAIRDQSTLHITTLGGLCAKALQHVRGAAVWDQTNRPPAHNPTWLDPFQSHTPNWLEAARLTAHTSILFGDPSLQFRSSQPGAMIVEILERGYSIPLVAANDPGFDVRIIDSYYGTGLDVALCAISYDPDPNVTGDIILMGSAETPRDGTGEVTIPLNWAGVPAVNGTELTLTVTAYNKVTHVSTIVVCVDPVELIQDVQMSSTELCVNMGIAAAWDSDPNATGYLVRWSFGGQTFDVRRTLNNCPFHPGSEPGTGSCKIAALNECVLDDQNDVIENLLIWTQPQYFHTFVYPSAQAAYPPINEPILLTKTNGNYYFPPDGFGDFQWNNISGAQLSHPYTFHLLHGIDHRTQEIAVQQSGETSADYDMPTAPVSPGNIGDYIGLWHWYVEFSNGCGSFSLPEEEQWRFYVYVNAKPVNASIRPVAESGCCYDADITFSWNYEDDIVPLYGYLEFDLNMDGVPELNETTQNLPDRTYTRSFAYGEIPNRIQWRIVSGSDIHCPEYQSDWIPLNLEAPDRAINLTPNSGDWICSSESIPQGYFFFFETTLPTEESYHTIHWQPPVGDEMRSGITIHLQEEGQPIRYGTSLTFDNLATMQGRWTWWVTTDHVGLCHQSQVVSSEVKSFHVSFLVEPPELLTPGFDSDVCPNDIVNFSWASHPNADYYTIYWHSPGPDIINFQLTNLNATSALFAPDAPGTWTWEVRAFDDHQECPFDTISETFAFNVVELPETAQLQAPRDGANVLIGLPQVYTWRIPADAEMFLVEWATSNRFEPDSIVSQIVTASGSISTALNVPSPQTLYWRVTSMRDGCCGSPSRIWSIHLDLPPLPTNVTLVSPPRYSTIYDDVPVLWEWSGGDYSAVYQIQWSNDDQFIGYTEEFVDGAVRSVFRSFHGVGVYYWRVRGENARGRSPWSTIWKGTCAPPSIPGMVILDTPRNGETIFEGDPATEFCVLTEPMAANYLFQWDMDGSFKNPIHSAHIEATELCVAMPLSPRGIWYWRAQAINSSGAGHWSDVRRVIVERAPLLLQVIPNRTERMSSKQQVFELSWPVVPGAECYTVQIASNRDFSTDVIQWNTELTRTSVDLGGCSAKYWRAKSRFDRTCGDWSSVHSFEETAPQDNKLQTTDASKKATPINGDAQADRTGADGLDAPQSTAVIPNTFTLYQNSPNPFNPNTEIRFDLPEDIRVELKVFNTLGQLVTTLADEVRPAGAYTITWNGTGQSGAPVSSGLYIYQLNAGKFTDAKKMILLK